MKHNWFYVSLVVALIVGVIVLWEAPRNLIPFGEPDREKLFPYAVIDDAHTRHFDTEGKLSYEFVAATLSHFRLDLSRVSEGDFTSLKEPQLTLHTETQPWLATADQGELSDAGATLTLWPNVRIWQEQSPQEVTELITSRLEIKPREKIIATDAEVVITSPQGRIQAQGMRVDLAQKRIQLLNRVKGYHEPIAD